MKLDDSLFSLLEHFPSIGIVFALETLSSLIDTFKWCSRVCLKNCELICAFVKHCGIADDEQ